MYEIIQFKYKLRFVSNQQAISIAKFCFHKQLSSYVYKSEKKKKKIVKKEP